jgi:hypothetical protein
MGTFATLRSGFIFAAMLLGLSASQCAPTPLGTPCRNDGECPDGERGHAYCVRRHCVECVTKASCGPHRTCRAGECVQD